MEPDTLTVVMRLIAATALGALVGVDRELSLKPAGVRTHALVALGSALMVSTVFGVFDGDRAGQSAAISRVIQGVIAGIGFVGGGVILHRGHGVLGLTTAASIWVVAAVGVTVGLGLWTTALAGTVLTLLVLTVGGSVDRVLHRWRGHSADPS
jgi:putative Mg2+ transporter-C (MgtC) family protein